MTVDVGNLNCTSSESPNKSSGDIGELKPCPFCQSEGHTLLRGFRYADECPDRKELAVMCPTCEARAPLKAWNTRTPDPESAAEIERLRREVEEANRFWNERCVQTSVNAHGWMQAHDQLLGFIQSRPDLLKVMMAEKFEIKYPAPADTPTLLQRALTAESAVAAAYENAAKIAEAKALEFLSPEYATGQPLSSFNERFACGQVASAIRAAVSKKTAESGHSPSTHNSESE